jgi:glutamate/tyrosine decarboxylase-like PLP-dependent enzyme
MGNQVYSTREEASFCNTQEHSADHEAGEIFDKTSKSHDGAPADNEHANVVRWTLELLEQDVGGNLQQNVGDEEDRQTVIEISLSMLSWIDITYTMLY